MLGARLAMTVVLQIRLVVEGIVDIEGESSYLSQLLGDACLQVPRDG